MNNIPYSVAFSYFPDGIGPMRFKELLDHFKDVKAAYDAPYNKLCEVLGHKITDNFITFRKTFNLGETLRTISLQHITVITLEDPLYPPQLKAISDPPICLYAKGNIELLGRDGACPVSTMFAIVGTRKATSYGLHVTETLTKSLVDNGLTIVSGMALGIDSQAHKTALENNGKTIAVLGCGVDIIYPPSNKNLYEQIVKKGLILSEFPPGHGVEKGLFVARNRIISALSKGILVVEGDEHSGALITARNAGEQGRDVFAIPGPITSSLSAGPHILIKQGAKMVTSAEDILEEYNIVQKKSSQLRTVTVQLTGLEKKIADILQTESLSSDELAIKLEINISELLQTLSIMELNGILKKSSEGTYILK